MGFDQSLVTGQVSHCTGEGFASVYLFTSYLVEKAVTWTIGTYWVNWCTWV